MQLYGKVTDLLSRLGETPETCTGRILSMSLFNDISCDKKDNEEECVANAKVVSILARKSLVLDDGHLLVQFPKRNGILWKRIVHKEFGIISRKRCWWNSPKADVHFSVRQLHCPGVSSKANDGKLSIHYCADQATIETIFRINVFCQSAQSLRSSRKHV